MPIESNRIFQYADVPLADQAVAARQSPKEKYIHFHCICSNDPERKIEPATVSFHQGVVCKLSKCEEYRHQNLLEMGRQELQDFYNYMHFLRERVMEVTTEIGPQSMTWGFDLLAEARAAQYMAEGLFYSLRRMNALAESKPEAAAKVGLA